MKPSIKIHAFLLIALLFIGFLPAVAQITINNSDMPSQGDTVRISTGLNLDFVDFTETGEDYFWDFSQLIPIRQQVDTFQDPWTMPFGYIIFAFLSDYGVRSMQNIPIPGFPFTDIYNFYKNKSDAYRGIGMGISIFEIPIPFFYDNPDVVYDFPVEYGNTWASEANIDEEVPLLGYLRLTRTHTDTVDGWGTLHTPYGSFEVLRLKSDVHEIDSIYIDSLEIGIPVERNYSVYQWLGKGQKIPLLQISSSLAGVLVDYIDSVRLIVDGIDDRPFIRNNDLQLFPNPTSGTIQLQFEMLENQEVSVALFDMQGREATHLYDGKLQKGNVRLIFNLADKGIETGQFILRLRSGNQLLNKKLIYKE